MAGFRRGRPETDDGSGAGAAAQPLLSILYPAVTPGDIGAGTLVESSGETVTFTRLSAKTLSLDAAETTTLDLANHVPGVSAKGLLMENSRTNLVTRNRQLDAAWVPQTITVIANDATAPDGTLTAERITATATSDCVLYHGHGAVDGTFYTVSCWAKSGTASFIQVAMNRGGALSTAYSPQFPLTSTWQRFEYAFESDATFVYSEVGWGPGASVGQYAYVWGADVIAGLYRQSSVITIASSATAVRDFCSIPSTKVPVASGRITFNFTPQWSTSPSVPTVLFTTTDGGDLHGLQLQTLTSGVGAPLRIKIGSGSATNYDSGNLAWVAGQTYAISLTWGGGTVTVSRDGVSVISTAASAPDSHGGSLRIGCLAGGNCADGYFSAFAVWAS